MNFTYFPGERIEDTVSALFSLLVGGVVRLAGSRGSPSPWCFRSELIPFEFGFIFATR